MSSYRAKNRIRNLRIARESEKRTAKLAAENNALLALRKMMTTCPTCGGKLNEYGFCVVCKKTINNG